MPTTAQTSYSELYSAYAAGTLDPAFALMVETQAVLRPDIHVDVARSEMVAGAMLEAADLVALTPGAADRALAEIDKLLEAEGLSRPAAVAVRRGVEDLLGLPEPLRARALIAADAAGWTGLSRGVHRLKLDLESPLEVELYRIMPGAAVPRHSHGGAEYTLVVAGGFSDEAGSYGPGDLVIQGPEHTHQPVGDAGEVCFALAVRDAGLRFTGVMGLIQRLSGH
jgi:putative transcriptional regulator